MKIYKGYTVGVPWAMSHIKANNITCRYFGWVGMVGNIDLIKIDGKIRKFDVNTHKEVAQC